MMTLRPEGIPKIDDIDIPPLPPPPPQPHSFSPTRTILGSRPALLPGSTCNVGPKYGGGGSIDAQEPGLARSVSSPPRLVTTTTTCTTCTTTSPHIQKPLFTPEGLGGALTAGRSLRRRATISRLDDLINKFESPRELVSQRSLVDGNKDEDVLRPLNPQSIQTIQTIQTHSSCQAQLPQPPSSLSHMSTAMGPSPQQHIPGTPGTPGTSPSPGRSSLATSLAATTTTIQNPHMSSHDPDVTISTNSRHAIETKGPVRCADVFYSAARDLGSSKAAKSYPAGTLSSSINRRPG